MAAKEVGQDRIFSAVETFKSLAEIPTVSSGEIERSSDGLESFDVKLTLSSRSYSTLARRTQNCHLKIASGKVISSFSSSAVDVGDDTIKAQFSSLPGSSSPWTVILREVNDKQGKDKRRFVELWRGLRCYKSAEVTKHHGAFTTNDTFGSFSIYDDMVLYSAEGNAPTREVDIVSRKDRKDSLKEWEYRPSLGEKFGSQVRPTIFLLQFNTNSKDDVQLSRLEAAQDEQEPVIANALLGQAVFSSSGQDIYLTAYPPVADGRRLGIIYCSNRPAVIYRAAIDKSAGGTIKDKDAVDKNVWSPEKWTRLSPKGFSARTVRAREGGCVWLQSEEEGAHRDCDALITYAEKTGEVKEEVSIQSVPDDSGWPGFFSDQLRRTCILGKMNGFVTDSLWGSSKTILFHEFGSGKTPVNLTPASDELTVEGAEADKGIPWSYTFLCSDGDDTILAARSSPTNPPQVLLGSFKSKSSVQWTLVFDIAQQWQDTDALSQLRTLKSTIEDTPMSASATKGDVPVQSIVIESKTDSQPQAAILFPHGGPHATTTTDWSPSNAALCLQGFTLVMPNYHGSLGRGQQFAHSLIGRCGTLDVQDCVASIDRLIEAQRVDRNRLHVQGGSHGGFLTAHLIGQYPDKFQRAIVRNPVIAAGVMEGTTDIPDWCYAEFGQPFPFGNSSSDQSKQEAAPPACLTASQYELLQKNSPATYIEAMKTPLLILLGLDDRRVPPAQSKLLYHRLKARGTPVRMLAFEGQDHALDGVECELISWEASVRWLQHFRP